MSTELPVLGPRCKDLSRKSMMVYGEDFQNDPDYQAGMADFWCDRTARGTGPDGGGVSYEECCATVRELVQAMPTLMASRSPTRRKHRLVYDANQLDQLPGNLGRSEGQASVADVAVNEAYDHTGDTYDFFEKLFNRTSLDDNGMSLI